MLITTKYSGATNHRPSRIVASCEDRKAYLSYDHSLSGVENHDNAAANFAAIYGVESPLVNVASHDNGYYYALRYRVRNLVKPE